MKKYLLSIVFIIGLFSIAAAQERSYTYIAQRYDWLAGVFRALGLPAGDGPAAFEFGQKQRAGTVYYDSTGEDAGLYLWDGSAWGQITAGGGGGSLPIQTFDILATGQSNMVNRDNTVGTWTYTTDDKIRVLQDNGTWQKADPATDNISPQDASGAGTRNNIAFVFAKEYLKRYPLTDTVRMIVSAKGGEPSWKWTPKTTGNGEKGTSNSMLDSLVNKLNRAPADYSAKVILVHQGENDDVGGDAKYWLDNWTEIYDSLVKHPRVDPRAIMVLGDFSNSGNYDSIRTAVDSLNSGMRLVAGRHIYAAKYLAESTGAGMFDPTHFNNEFIDRIGADYFAVFNAPKIGVDQIFRPYGTTGSINYKTETVIGPVGTIADGLLRLYKGGTSLNSAINFDGNSDGMFMQLKNTLTPGAATGFFRSYAGSGNFQISAYAGGIETYGNIVGSTASGAANVRFTMEADATPLINVHNTSGTAVAIMRGYAVGGDQATFTLGAVNIGTAGSVRGQLKLQGATSGFATVQAPSVAGSAVFTLGGTTGLLPSSLTGTATLDFASTAAGTKTDLTITVTGAVDGDAVYVGVPNASTVDNGCFTAWVSAANTVTVRFTNNDLTNAKDPASGIFRVSVTKF